MKTVCVYHSIDLDGWMSAAIVKYWFEEIYNSSAIFVYQDNIVDYDGNKDFMLMLGYNYGQPIPDLSGYDKVIMCDISFPVEEMIKLNIRLDTNFIWLDHHFSAIKDNPETIVVKYKGLRDTKFAACELTWKYFFPNENIPEIVRLLGRYDCFGHKGTDEETKVLEFQYGAREAITNYEEAYNALLVDIEFKNDPSYSIVNRILISGENIYQYLCTEAKQDYKNGFEIKIAEPNVFTAEFGSTNTIIRKFICINKERFNPINFGIDYHKDGYDGAACFHYAKGKWNFSLYNDNGLVDCSVIAKQFGGGGHKGASGFVVDDLNKVFNGV